MDYINFDGIAEAFADPTNWDNYPALAEKRRPGDPIPGIHVPDRWGHFRKGHKLAQVIQVWSKIDQQYDKALLDQLDRLYPLDYPPAKTISGWQKLQFCYYYHNTEGLTRAVEQITQEAVTDALAPYRPSPKVIGRPARLKRAYHPQAAALPRPGPDPLLDQARALYAARPDLTAAIIANRLKIGPERANRLWRLMLDESNTVY